MVARENKSVNMKIDLAFITYNRLEYTKLALQSVLADPQEEFSLTIWDNASSDDTPDYLKSIKDHRIKDIILSKNNVGQVEAVNRIWSASNADLLGKLDNDCLVTPGWTRTLAQAHADIDRLGVVACWHFFPEDFDEKRAEHKIQTFGRHRIFRHPWTCGTGLLVKNETYRKLGPIIRNSTTGYWLNMARKGYVNGFYYPLVYQEHMDDPRSEHCLLNKLSFDEAYKHCFGFQAGIISDIENYKKLHQDYLDNLLDDPFEASYYSPFRRRIRRILNRFRKLGS